MSPNVRGRKVRDDRKGPEVRTQDIARMRTQCIPGGSPTSSLYGADGQHKTRGLTQSDYRKNTVAMSLACEARSLLMDIVDFASSRYSGSSSKHPDRWQKPTHLALRFKIFGAYEAPIASLGHAGARKHGSY